MASISEKPVKINSYIVLDLETTGLPTHQLKTKITEISILCVYRSHVLHTYQTNRGDRFLPRVINKLNLCIYPRKLVNPGAAEVSGLNNELLQNCKPFNEDVFDTISSVIKSVEPPVCLLAHNGNKFDFPILRSEIANIGKAFGDDVYCADTLLAFRELVPKNPVVERAVTIEDLSYDIASELDQTIVISDEENEIPFEGNRKSTKSHNHSETKNIEIDWGSDSLNGALNLAAEEAERSYLKEVKATNSAEMKKINETTPKPRKSRTLPVKKKLLNDKKSVCKRLFNSKNEGSFPITYKLSDLYTFFTGKQIVNAHHADSDTHALLECVVAHGPPVLHWIDINCKPFNDVKKLW